MGADIFPKCGVGNIGKSTDLVVAALWDLGLDILVLYKGLDNLNMCAHGLGIVGLHHLKALRVVLLCKEHVPQERRVPLRGSCLCNQGLYVISVPFWG